MGASRIEDMATIDQQIIDAQAIAYSQSPTQLGGYRGATVPWAGAKTLQPGQQTAATALIPSNTNQPTITTPGIFEYKPGNAPPPPKSTQNRKEPLEQEPELDKSRGARIAGQAGQVARSIGNIFANANRRVGGVPTPGGIWVPFWILIFMYLVLIPSNGHTRMYWFWLTIIGSAVLTGTYNGPRTDTGPGAGSGTASNPTSDIPLNPTLTPLSTINTFSTGVSDYMFSLSGSAAL